MITKKCECEHESHFCYGSTPNGNPAHKYGVHYADHFIVTVRITDGGDFSQTLNICKNCAKDCYHPDHMTDIGMTIIKIESRVRPMSEVRQEWRDKYGNPEDI